MRQQGSNVKGSSRNLRAEGNTVCCDDVSDERSTQHVFPL